MATNGKKNVLYNSTTSECHDQLVQDNDYSQNLHDLFLNAVRNNHVDQFLPYQGVISLEVHK